MHEVEEASGALAWEKLMPFDMQLYLENRRRFLENRAKFPLDELAPYVGRWVAWKPDGTRIVASATNPEDLEDLVRAAGEDPTQCILEEIPEQDTVIRGGLLPEGL
jgi:hypothetical protein